MKRASTRTLFVAVTMALAFFAGCTDGNSPATSSAADATLGMEAVITQDLAQLSTVSVPATPSYGVFSIGWNQFVSPVIQNAGTIGKAFAVVHEELPQPGVRPSSVDVGMITLSFSGGSAELTKQVTPRGDVLYSTFDRGLRSPTNLPVNVPFIAGGEYVFAVSGSGAFTPASFRITAPASLLDVTSHNDGDVVNLNSDLTVTWTGGAIGDSVLVRLVPHFRPQQMNARGSGGGMGGNRGPGGSGPRPGMGPQHGIGGAMGPMLGLAMSKGIVRKVPNTGTATFAADELQDLVNGTIVEEIMVGVAQVVEEVVDHDGRPYTLLLRNGNRVVLTLE